MANMKKLTRDYGEIIWTGKKCIMGMPISFTRYILTDSKLITRVGLLNLKEDEIELYRVYDKSMKLPLTLQELGAVDCPIEALARHCCRKGAVGHFKPLEKADVEALLRAAQ